MNIANEPSDGHDGQGTDSGEHVELDDGKQKEALSGPELIVILVEPQIQGNIGAVARAMMNFDVHDLRIVSDGQTHPITEVARQRAVHAQEVLNKATIHATFESAVADLDLLVATTGVVPDNQKRHLRSYLELSEFVERAWGYDGRIGLIFGRENFGLLNPELEMCDLVVAIPTSEGYPIMNLSHAVSAVLYHLFVEGRQRRGEGRPRRDASVRDRGRLFDRIDVMLEQVNFPEHKRANTSVMIKRILGRAMINRWEFHTLMGVLSRIEFTLGWGSPAQWAKRCPKCKTSIPINTEKRPLKLTCPKCRASGIMYKP